MFGGCRICWGGFRFKKSKGEKLQGIAYFWKNNTAMPSPFPGMDPYLEGHLFPDVHNSLAYLVTVQLTPQLPDAYIVHLGNYTVEDTSPQVDVGIMYPDVEVFHRTDTVREPNVPYGNHSHLLTPETIVLPAIKPVEVRIPVVEIRDRKNNKLITAI
jgi:hypothetical protein